LRKLVLVEVARHEPHAVEKAGAPHILAGQLDDLGQIEERGAQARVAVEEGDRVAPRTGADIEKMAEPCGVVGRRDPRGGPAGNVLHGPDEGGGPAGIFLRRRPVGRSSGPHDVGQGAPGLPQTDLVEHGRSHAVRIPLREDPGTLAVGVAAVPLGQQADPDQDIQKAGEGSLIGVEPARDLRGGGVPSIEPGEDVEFRRRQEHTAAHERAGFSGEVDRIRHASPPSVEMAVLTGAAVGAEERRRHRMRRQGEGYLAAREFGERALGRVPSRRASPSMRGGTPVGHHREGCPPTCFPSSAPVPVTTRR